MGAKKASVPKLAFSLGGLSTILEILNGLPQIIALVTSCYQLAAQLIAKYRPTKKLAAVQSAGTALTFTGILAMLKALEQILKDLLGILSAPVQSPKPASRKRK